MGTHEVDFMRPFFDDAEEVLIRSRMHPVMAHAVIEFARIGANLPRKDCAAAPSTGDGELQSGDLLTTQQAARRLGVSEKQVYRLVSQGRVRSYVFSRRHRFRVRDLDALIERSTPGVRIANAARIAADERRAA